jgi:hypothetical protein
MSFEVSQAYDDDFARFVPSLFGVMGTGGFVAALWPNNQTEGGQKQAIERFMIEKKVPSRHEAIITDFDVQVRSPGH